MSVVGRVLGFLRGDPNLKSLAKKGLVVGEGFNMMAGCTIDYSHCWLIRIGNNVTFAPKVCVLAHDASTKAWLGYTKIGLVTIGDNVFIGAGSIILPGVAIGDGAVIGAGSVVSKDVPAGMVYAGVPAREICSRDAYIDKENSILLNGPVYGDEYTLREGVTDEMKRQMIRDLAETGRRCGFVK